VMFPDWKTTPQDMEAIVSGMATDRIRKGARPHVYIKEHMDKLKVSDDEMAGRLGLGSRSAVWKRYKEQHRLDPGKIQEFADALGIPSSQLYYPPGVPSLDAIAEAEEATPEQREMAADVLQRMLKKKTGTEG
jgi:transcriptional regulator with XRE-family HTH domain